MLAEAQAAREAVDRLSAEPRGVVRVSVPVGLAQQQIPQLLPEFLARYPKVRVQQPRIPERSQAMMQCMTRPFVVLDCCAY